MALRRRGGHDALNPWPGYVDALSTLLMVIIFVLLVFVLAQAFLSVALSGRDRALDRLNRQMAELTDMLSLERGQGAELKLSVAQLGRDLQMATSARDGLTQQLAEMRLQSDRLAVYRDGLKTDRDTLSAKLADTLSQAQSTAARTDQLQGQLAEAARKSDNVGREAAATAALLAASRVDLNVSQRQLDDARKQAAAQLAASRVALADFQRQLEEMKRQAAALDKTVIADKATIEARLSDLARMAEQVRALTALRDQLERQAQDAAVRATSEAERRAAVQAQLGEQQKLGDSAKAQVALLTQQVDQLRAQLAGIVTALQLAEASAKNKDVQIANLGSQLNSALAQKVEELQRYRSEFFGKLREVLANRPGIQVVGDRFVFQSEVLFPVGGADMGAPGQEEIDKLATTLKAIIPQIPSGLNWILRIDGHADKQGTTGSRFASNWELSTQRAINVVKLLNADGIPANRLAATGFGDNQPLDSNDTAEAYAKNRRIEIRLTDR